MIILHFGYSLMSVKHPFRLIGNMMFHVRVQSLTADARKTGAPHHFQLSRAATPFTSHKSSKVSLLSNW